MSVNDGGVEHQDGLSCQEFAELVTDYLEGALDLPTRARFDEHLVDCPACPVYLRQMWEIIGAVGMLHEEHVSTEAREVLLSRFRSWKRQPGQA
jgi:anti-sigma factor RsiW